MCVCVCVCVLRIESLAEGEETVERLNRGHWLVCFFRSLSQPRTLSLYSLHSLSLSTSLPLLPRQQLQYPQAGPSWRAVLRKKPPGVTLPSAHAVEREAALFLGLAGGGGGGEESPPGGSPPRVPVPRVLALERGDRPLGTPFYVMEFVAGRVFADPALPGAGEKERRALYAAAAEALARVHSVDVRASPELSKLLLSPPSSPSSGGSGGGGGGGVNYCARQIGRWERQYLAQAGPGKKRPLLPEMLELAAFLKTHVPKTDASLEDSGGRPTLVHGDFRIDNLVFDCERCFDFFFFVRFCPSDFFFSLRSLSFFPLAPPHPRKTFSRQRQLPDRPRGARLGACHLRQRPGRRRVRDAPLAPAPGRPRPARAASSFALLLFADR